MSKIDDLTKVAAALSDQQLDGLLDFARSLAEGSYLETAPPEVRDAIERGLSQYRPGLGEPADVVFQGLRRRLEEPKSE